MTTMISKLPRDLVEEILSRVPLKSMGVVRSTCKSWNVLSKDESFTKKHIAKASREKEFLMVTEDCRVCLMSINLYKTHDNKFDISVSHKGTLVTRESSGKKDIEAVFHCSGLLLSVLRFIPNRLVVWNPYLCKIRWIKIPTAGYMGKFAYGYDKSSYGSYKILMDCYTHYKIYDLSSNSNSWRVINATPFQDGPLFGVHDVSLKGDFYWCRRDRKSQDVYLACFDFTRERFGPRLPMPYDSFEFDASLSSVREEQLALLVQRPDTPVIEFWVTNKIEPDAVSWRNLFKFDMKQVPISISFSTFFIVEEKKIAVLFGHHHRMFDSCIIGENGYYKKMDLEKSIDIQLRPFVCSYVPTSVQIK